MKRLKTPMIFLMTLALLLTMGISSPVFADTEFDSIADSAFLMEASTGKVLYEKNANIALPPASITKIMTLLLGFEALEQGVVQWETPVTISERAWRMGGSRMFLEVDTQVSYGDIITGISVVSANDGCVALAEHLYGSEEAFVQVMNKRAQEIGLTKTQFKNSTGLPEEGHHMSARDIAVLAQYLIEQHPRILEIESMREFTFNDILQYNRNPLLGTFPGADGLKTGWTNEAGYCLVGTALQDNMRLISVVLNTEDDQERLAASTELLNYGYRNYENFTVVQANQTLEEAQVKNGKELTVPIQAASDLSVVIPSARREEILFAFSLENDPIPAPITAGSVIGQAEVRLDGEVLAVVDMLAAADVERAGFFEVLFRSIGSFFRSLFRVSRG